MYTHQEAAAIRQRFWINFGKYMSPVPSSVGEKINWINYRTGVKPVSFKMDAGFDFATIAIEIAHKDPGTIAIYFNQFKSLKKTLEAILEEKWEWYADAVNAGGKSVARISTILEGVNVHNEADWPAIISFLKKRIMGLDEFWNEYKEVFEF